MLWVFAWVVVRVIPFFSNLLSITGEAFWSFSEFIWPIFGCITPTSAPLAPCYPERGLHPEHHRDVDQLFLILGPGTYVSAVGFI